MAYFGVAYLGTLHLYTCFYNIRVLSWWKRARLQVLSLNPVLGLQGWCVRNLCFRDAIVYYQCLLWLVRHMFYQLLHIFKYHQIKILIFMQNSEGVVNYKDPFEGIPRQSSVKDSELSLLRAQVQSLVGELRSCKLRRVAKKKKKNPFEYIF